MAESKLRGYYPEDKRQFCASNIDIINKASKEVQFLLERGYDMKKTTQFVGNHYMFSERQRLLIARAVSTKQDIYLRTEKEILSKQKQVPDVIYIDGFNTIITIEVALSGSPVFSCYDNTIRDLAELRGSYKIIDKTPIALELLKKHLESLNAKSVEILLDKPVSNVGRLKSLCYEIFNKSQIKLVVTVMDEVDKNLYDKNGVITSDAVILNKCKSWINIMPEILADINEKNLISITNK